MRKLMVLTSRQVLLGQIDPGRWDRRGMRHRWESVGKAEGFQSNYLGIWETLSVRGSQIFQKSRNHLKILCAERVTKSKFHTENPKKLDVTVKI